MSYFHMIYQNMVHIHNMIKTQQEFEEYEFVNLSLLRKKKIELKRR